MHPQITKTLPPQKGRQDLIASHYDWEDHQEKTPHNYAINQVTECESESQDIESGMVVATLYSIARATAL